MSPPYGSGGGGYGPPGGGYGPPGGGYGGPPPGGGYGGPPGGGGYGPPGGGYGGPPGGYGGPPGGGGYGGPPPVPPPPGFGGPPVTVEWEDKSIPFFTRLFRTIKDTSFAPTEFYERAAQSDEPMSGVLAGVAGSGVGGIGLGLQIGGIYILMGLMGAFVSGMGGGRSSTGAVLGAFAAFGIVAAFVYPIVMAMGALVNPWVAGGLHHVLLMLYKGASRPYTASVRVAGYANATNGWMLIPIAGFFLAPICHIISLVVGLSIVHRCSVGKVLLALFTPGLVCCFCYAMTIGVTMMIGAASH